VVRAIGRRLAAGQQLADSQTSVGESVGQMATGAASAVGTAAGAAVTAPFAVVDPRSRDALGERLEQLGDTLGQPLR
jgi:esterase/lipase superfamily enzyme